MINQRRGRHRRRPLPLALDIVIFIALLSLALGVLSVYTQPLPAAPSTPQVTMLPLVDPLGTWVEPRP